MNSGRTVLAQLIEHLPHKEFHKRVARYRGDRFAKKELEIQDLHFRDVSGILANLLSVK